MLTNYISCFSFSNKLLSITWQQANRRFQQEYHNVLTLFDLILSIPATSTANEVLHT